MNTYGIDPNARPDIIRANCIKLTNAGRESFFGDTCIYTTATRADIDRICGESNWLLPETFCSDVGPVVTETETVGNLTRLVELLETDRERWRKTAESADSALATVTAQRDRLRDALRAVVTGGFTQTSTGYAHVDPGAFKDARAALAARDMESAAK